VLFRSSQYRIITIDKVCKFFEYKDVGISNMNFINSLDFKLYLFYKLRKPKKHIFVLTNKLYTKKSNCKEMFLDIQIIINRCFQQLLLLVLEPLMEARADFSSYSYRNGRSVHNALGQLKKNLESWKSQFSK
jgi:retron-type reverse transcriptase